ncbi:hypothetical protein [uncultured Gimesia sp.]|uniref:hypothetical protein n=1 Tax=uncultured Gimesia sp. TaxID=1678688 RepID=UPI0026023CC1|nr:hypothetical protein [uncultured Gimesia sp.]
MKQLMILLLVLVGNFETSRIQAAEKKPLEIGNQRELFVDHHLIDQLKGTELRLHHPVDEGIVLKFDKPWEGLFCGYCTIIKDGDRYRAYYRGRPSAGADGDVGEVYCYAESKDGVNWVKPQFSMFEKQGHKKNNIILADAAPMTHNLSPFLDTRPGIPKAERFKALGGTMKSGLVAFTSPDGIHWKQHPAGAVITTKMVPYPYMFDSQNVAFWSPVEKKYLSYFRVFKDKIRRIARVESDDFIHWSKPVLMEYTHRGEAAPIEHLYTNQTHPYFRAPHIYLAVAARFMPGRQVLTDAQAAKVGVHPKYFKDTSDAILMTTRGDNTYQRTFRSGFITGGIGAQNWVSRTNYPALNVVQTGPSEMSVYVNQDYAQKTAHLRRYSLRLDGFASVRAGYDGGELLTKPIIFDGSQLSINFSTSAAGGIKVEIQDEAGKAIPGFTLADSQEQIGNEVNRIVSWKGGHDLKSLSGKPVRLRFVMKDADLYSLQFTK